MAKVVSLCAIALDILQADKEFNKMILGNCRKRIQLFLLPALLILSGLAHSSSFPSVQRFQFTTASSELQ